MGVVFVDSTLEALKERVDLEIARWQGVRELIAMFASEAVDNSQASSALTELAKTTGSPVSKPRFHRDPRGRKPKGRISMREAAIEALQDGPLAFGDLFKAATKLGSVASSKASFDQSVRKARAEGEIILKDGLYHLGKIKK